MTGRSAGSVIGPRQVGPPGLIPRHVFQITSICLEQKPNKKPRSRRQGRVLKSSTAVVELDGILEKLEAEGGL